MCRRCMASPSARSVSKAFALSWTPKNHGARVTVPRWSAVDLVELATSQPTVSEASTCQGHEHLCPPRCPHRRLCLRPCRDYPVIYRAKPKSVKNPSGCILRSLPSINDSQFLHGVPDVRCVTAAIADDLGITTKTVENHRRIIINELGLKRPIEIVRLLVTFEERGFTSFVDEGFS